MQPKQRPCTASTMACTPDSMKPLQRCCNALCAWRPHKGNVVSTSACAPGLQAVVYPLQALPGVGHVHRDDCARPALPVT